MTSQLQGADFSSNLGEAFRAVGAVGDTIGQIDDPRLKLRVMEALGRAAGALLEAHGLVTANDDTFPVPTLSVVPMEQDSLPASAQVVDVRPDDVEEVAVPSTETTDPLGIGTLSDSDGSGEDADTFTDLVVVHTSPAPEIEPIRTQLARAVRLTVAAPSDGNGEADKAPYRGGLEMQRSRLLTSYLAKNIGVQFSPAELAQEMDPDDTMSPEARAEAFRLFVHRHGSAIGLQHSGNTSTRRYWVEAVPDVNAFESTDSDSDTPIADTVTGVSRRVADSDGTDAERAASQITASRKDQEEPDTDWRHALRRERAMVWTAYFQNHRGESLTPAQIGDIIDPEGLISTGARRLAFKAFLEDHGTELGIRSSGATSSRRYWLDVLPETQESETGLGAKAIGALSIEAVSQEPVADFPVPVEEELAGAEVSGLKFDSGDSTGDEGYDADQTAAAESGSSTEYSLTEWGLAYVYGMEGTPSLYLGEGTTPLRLGDAAVMTAYFLADNPNGLYFGHLRSLLEQQIGVDIPPGRITAVISELKNELAVYQQAHQLEIVQRYDDTTHKRSTHYRLLGSRVEYVAGALPESEDDSVVFSTGS